MHQNHHTARRCLAILIIIALLLGSLPAVALAADPAVKPEEKCTAELRKAMDEAEEADRIPVAILRADFPEGYLDGRIAEKCGQAPSEDADPQEKENYLHMAQLVPFWEYSAYNRTFIQECLPDVYVLDTLYASSYSPRLWLYLTKAEIAAAAADDSVISLDLYLYDGKDETRPPEEKYSADLQKKLSEATDADLISVFIRRKAVPIDHLMESANGGARLPSYDHTEFLANIDEVPFGFLSSYETLCYYSNNAFRTKRLPALNRDRMISSGRHTTALYALLTKAEIASAAEDDSVLDIGLYLDGNAVTKDREEHKAEITGRFPDEAFRDEVYKAIGKEPGEPIYNTDVLQVYSLKFNNREITSLAGIEYFCNLTTLTVGSRSTELDLTHLPNLRSLDCRNNQLQTLRIPGDLTGLYCSNNKLTELTIAAPALEFVLCGDNQLETLDLTGCIGLTELYCGRNNLYSLDISPCPLLQFLDCKMNYLKEPADIAGYDEKRFLSRQYEPDPEDSFAVLEYFSFYPQKDEAIWPLLDKETKAEICLDYGEGRSDPAGAIVEQYYGCHSGWQVVLMGMDGQQKPKDPLDLRIGGFVFKLTNPADRSAFLCWKDGQFVTVEDAHAGGRITNADLYDVYRVFYRGSNPNHFSDVNQNSWYYEAVRYVWNCNLFNGVSNNRFAPDGVMNRAMLVTVLWRQNGEPAAGGNPFSDVAEGRWYTDAVAWAAEAGIVNGVGGGRFAPDSPLTREQLVTILYRLSGAEDSAPAIEAGTFPDAGRISAWARSAMAWAVENGVIEGMARIDAQGSRQLWLEPGTYVTRAQAATILLRIARSDPAPAA